MSRPEYHVAPNINGIKRRKGDSEHITSEWKLALMGLLVSLAVLMAKFVYSNRKLWVDYLSWMLQVMSGF